MLSLQCPFWIGGDHQFDDDGIRTTLHKKYIRRYYLPGTLIAQDAVSSRVCASCSTLRGLRRKDTLINYWNNTAAMAAR